MAGSIFTVSTSSGEFPPMVFFWSRKARNISSGILSIPLLIYFYKQPSILVVDYSFRAAKEGKTCACKSSIFQPNRTTCPLPANLHHGLLAQALFLLSL